MLKFVLPQKLEDLLHPHQDPNIYYVNDELTSLEVAQKLSECEQKLLNDPLAIVDEFGTLYSVLKNFSTLDPLRVEKAWILAYKTTNKFNEELRKIFSVLNESTCSQTMLNLSSSQAQGSQESRGNLFESLEEKLQYSNSLKMLIYIDCIFIQLFEDNLSSENLRQNFNDTLSETTTKRKKKQSRNNAEDVAFNAYDKYREKVMRNLLQLISMPLNKVTGSPTETSDIVGQIMRSCYKMIENSTISGVTKNKDLLDTIFALLGSGIEKYNQSLSFCLKFIQLLQYREQLAPLLAELVEFIVTRHDQRLLIGEILREIDRIDIRELSSDSSCPRALSTFLINLSEKCPQEFIPFLDHMFEYLEQDSYIMRNASLTVFVNLIIKVAHKENEHKTIRDEMLDALLAHIKDITGYTRSKALFLWMTLCENQCVPITYIQPVTTAAIGRLRDKSCYVRKNATRYLISILSRNPFGQKLPLQIYMKRYKIELAKLVRLKAQDKEVDVVETLSQSSLMDSITSETDPEKVHPNMKIAIALPEESQVETQQRKCDYLRDSIEFTKLIHKAIPLITEMLFSKNSTDSIEAIEFFVACHEFHIDEALDGFKQMILLINGEEKTVKEKLCEAYKRVFFKSSRYVGKSNVSSLVVNNFMNLVEAATIGQFISLEKLLGQFLESSDFTKDMEIELWARFTKTRANTTDEQSITAIMIIGLLAATRPDIVNHNLPHCVKYGLAGDGCSDLKSRLVRETCIAIRKSIPRKIEDRRRCMRFSKDDVMFLRLADILVDSLTNLESTHWYSMCDEALRLIFAKAENPEKICESIYKRFVDKLLINSVQSNTLLTQDTNRNESPDYVFQPSSIQSTATNGIQDKELVHPIVLARFIHFLGDVAFNLIVFLEMDVLVELKIRNASSNDVSVTDISAHNISISSRRRSRRYGGGGAPNKSVDDQNLEEEIGLGGAEAEDVEMEFIGAICDDEIVTGKNLLAKLSTIVIEVVSDPIRYSNIQLMRASSLALARFMMVSTKFCDKHLRLLFTILEKTKDHGTKINLLIAISDLCVRFPNQLDCYTHRIFDCLQSKEVDVRRTALKLLSRLVLCDILKAKDQISTMANLIVDGDEDIASQARHFFLELSKKLNAIYNVLPDIISRLSDSRTGINEASFRIVMRFMFELIDKSHQIDRLVDKLCGRFMDTDDERHWSDLAYCLSLLKYSDKSMAKLFDKFDCYKDKLCIDSVHESIVALIANYRKTPHMKNEMKQMLDEFEAKIAKSIGEQKDKTMAEDEPKENGQDEADAPAATAGVADTSAASSNETTVDDMDTTTTSE